MLTIIIFWNRARYLTNWSISVKFGLWPYEAFCLFQSSTIHLYIICTNVFQVAEKNNQVMQTKVDKLQEKVFEKTQELESLKDTSKLIEAELRIFDMNKEVCVLYSS